jgi:biopolymer transport protein ExbD
LTGKVKKVDAEISSASMADIAFLLIVFFMVTAVFSATKGLEFKLPSDDKSNQASEEEQAIFFKVLANGQILMDCDPATEKDIIPYVLPKLENWPDKPIIIYSEPEAPYQGMVSVYDELQRAAKPKELGGMGLLVKSPNISIPTQSEISEYEAMFGYNPFARQCGQ